MASSITELKTTIFLTPIISSVLRWISLFVIKIIGWKITGEKPKHAKYIVVAAPHTSNWDFLILLMAGFILRWDIHWMGKASLFPWPFTRFMVWLGGIPIDRSKTNNVVTQMADYFSSVDQLSVLIPPEGTRSKVESWKTGFYYIAEKAEVPIVLGFIDAGTKTAGLGPTFDRTGDVEADMQVIRSFYTDKVGIIRENT